MNRAQIKTAVRLFRSPLAPRDLRRANARKWLCAVHQLGDNWILCGGEAKWGHGQRSQS